MALLGPSHFEKLFAPLQGKSVGFVPLNGNVGDHLNHKATYQLFEYFNVDYEMIPPAYVHADSIAGRFDELVISGGGNMGGPLYILPYQSRQELVKTGLPLTVFPQSFVGNEEDLSPYKKVYAREKVSLGLYPELELAPDLALGYLGPFDYGCAQAKVGIFLRTDVERKFEFESYGDPAELSLTVDEYFDLASRFEHIITDRLHFCIAALLIDRRVTLLPNSYPKNESFFNTWLSDQCRWREDPAGITAIDQEVTPDLFDRLVGSPKAVYKGPTTPVQDPGFFLDKDGDRFSLTHVDGSQHIYCNESTAMVWQLSDGTRTVAEISELLLTAFPDNRLALARDIQESLRKLVKPGAIVIDEAYPLPKTTRSVSRSPEKILNTQAAAKIVVPAPALKLEVHQPRTVNGKYRASASLDGLELWFDVDEKFSDWISTRADPFVLTALMIAMHQGLPLDIRGAPVSSGLLRNLEEFQSAWASWRKQLSAVELRGEQVGPDRGRTEAAICAFSGGVDSCFTVYDHLIDPRRRWRHDLEAALLIQGFDFDADDVGMFSKSYTNAAQLLDGLPIQLLSVRTNAKPHLGNWLDVHGMLLAASLSLFSQRFETGLIGATLPYLVMQPLGSNPTTDWLMGSDQFSISHYGAATSRLDKIGALSTWPAVQAHLRVCWQSENSPTLNCGSCLTCVLATIMFQCHRHQPECLPKRLSAEAVAGVLSNREIGRLEWYDMRCILQRVEKLGLEATWIEPLRAAVANVS